MHLLHGRLIGLTSVGAHVASLGLCSSDHKNRHPSAPTRLGERFRRNLLRMHRRDQLPAPLPALDDVGRGDSGRGGASWDIRTSAADGRRPPDRRPPKARQAADGRITARRTASIGPPKRSRSVPPSPPCASLFLPSVAPRKGAIRWRPEEDKLGREWTVPVTPTVRDEIQRVTAERPGVGEAWLFPAPESEGHLDVTLASRWWRHCEEKAEGVEHQDGGGWHMLRRRWATKRKDMSLKDVAHAGGWKGTQVLQDVYQQEDFDAAQEVVLAARPLRRRA